MVRIHGKGEGGDEDSGDARVIPLLPLRDIVVFPHMVVPLFVGRAKSIQALEDAMEGSRDLMLAAQRQAGQEEPSSEDIYPMGTLGKIIQLLRLPDGTVKVLVEGIHRAQIQSFQSRDPYFSVRVTELPDESIENAESEGLVRTVHTTFENYAKLNKKAPPELLSSIASIDEPGRLADSIVAHLNLKLEERQELLEMTDIMQRMQAEIEVLEVERKIRGRVKKQMERSQKEYYLNEQMRAIQKELGERDESKGELDELDELLSAKLMPDDARERVEKEIKKLKMMSPMSAEATVVRNYIDWMLDLPWEEYCDELEDIDEAQSILDADHYGLAKPGGADPRRPHEGADSLPGGSPRRGQDLSGQVDRSSHRPRFRAHQPGWGSRRSGNSRPSSHLCRCSARQGDSGAQEGWHQQPRFSPG